MTERHVYDPQPGPDKPAHYQVSKTSLAGCMQPQSYYPGTTFHRADLYKATIVKTGGVRC